ncbi:hypothetical protein PGTUg99_007259 [Puccinia graminis f. sp. tritici]|uniref:Uncharacterized protein n=1 Tax=Puccinia graminis f. sp. tritici TaxID=56615 RepID=A0A5B0QLN6_PUCGR|nr:hypothetical protein PGTUg99_007259 [Puccinia graminis f. sp. tritici]
MYALEACIGRVAEFVHPPTCLEETPIRPIPTVLAEPADRAINHPGSIPRCALGATSDCPTVLNAIEEAALGPLGGAPDSRAARSHPSGAQLGAPQYRRGEHRPSFVQLIAGSRGPHDVRSSGAQLDPLCSRVSGA